MRKKFNTVLNFKMFKKLEFSNFKIEISLLHNQIALQWGVQKNLISLHVHVPQTTKFHPILVFLQLPTKIRCTGCWRHQNGEKLVCQGNVNGVNFQS